MTTVADVEGETPRRPSGTPVDDILRLETIAIGHAAPRGSAHVTDHVIAGSAGQPSMFNRACALSREQPDIGIGELEAFFDGLPHALWLQDEDISEPLEALLAQRGYVALPPQLGMLRQPGTPLREHLDVHHHADLLTRPGDAAAIAAVTATSYGFGVDDQLLLEDLARAVLRHTKPWDHGAIYGIHDDGDLVATSALLCTNTTAGITAVSTVPRARHHGFGTLAVERAIRDAAALGCDTAAAIATPDSRSILEDLGFEPATTYRVFRWGRP